MSKGTACFSNNPTWAEEGLDVIFVDGTPRDVFVQGRDRIHRGWKLALHPLYGNFPPARHPYRTLLLLAGNGSTVDLESLSLIEEAIAAFDRDGGRCVDGRALDKNTASHYALLDRSLTESLVRQHIKRLRKEDDHEA